MACYLTNVSSFLPGDPIENANIERYIGSLEGEAETRKKVLAMNGIVRRHYAQNEQQQQTHDVYQLGAEAAKKSLHAISNAEPVTYLAAGTTYSPLAAPGYASLLHSRLQESGLLRFPVEISSHAGICSSAANGMVAAIRAVETGHHQTALSVGAEHPSEILKSSVIQPIDDRADHAELRQSRWFMSVFLRFMLSDGSGAVLVQNSPPSDRLSLKVNWTYARSFANEAPLCMKLEGRSALLSQDLGVLSINLVPLATRFLKMALDANQDSIDNYHCILPHMSSFFFRRKMERAITRHSIDPDHPTPYWTNLATAGNTGTASIYVMLEEYLRITNLSHGDRILLFIPESGQFNFVLISLSVNQP